MATRTIQVNDASPALAPPRADEVIAFDARTLTRDLIAIVTIGLIAAVYHLQNPILRDLFPFGRAFRNDTLQPVIAVALLLTSVILVRGTTVDLQVLRRNPFLSIAAGILVLYALYGIAAIVFGVHPLASAFGIDAATLAERIGDGDTIPALAALEGEIAVAALGAWAAILSVFALWQPWTRFPLYIRAVIKQAAPLGVALLVLGRWELLINLFQIQEFLLPRPSVIAATLAETYPRLVSAGWNTFQNAFWGFAFGCGAGVLTGIVAARFTAFSRALLPIAIAINAIPIIALAPIFNNWFGALNAASKIAIVAVLAYFPTMISTVRGLTSVDPLSLELMTSYAANNWQIFSKLRLPNALPYIFSSFKVATTLSMIGAIVSEYFGGSTAGLGFRIRDDAGLFKYPEAWSAIVIASLFGIGFYLVVSTVERAVMSWHVSFRES